MENDSISATRNHFSSVIQGQAWPLGMRSSYGSSNCGLHVLLAIISLLHMFICRSVMLKLLDKTSSFFWSCLAFSRQTKIITVSYSWSTFSKKIRSNFKVFQDPSETLNKGPRGSLKIHLRWASRQRKIKPMWHGTVQHLKLFLRQVNKENVKRFTCCDLYLYCTTRLGDVLCFIICCCPLLVAAMLWVVVWGLAPMKKISHNGQFSHEEASLNGQKKAALTGSISTRKNSKMWLTDKRGNCFQKIVIIGNIL